MRKCYEEDGKQREHWLKLQEFAKRMEGTEMMHKEFLNMIRSDKMICNLSDEEWGKRRFSRRSDYVICRKVGLGGEDDQ